MADRAFHQTTDARHKRDSERRKTLGVDGFYCVICGRGPYVKVGKHVERHGLTAKQYRKQFPGVPTIPETMREAWAQELAEIGMGPQSRLGKRKRFCCRGHALRGDNVRVVNAKRGVERRCVKCSRERDRLSKSRSRERLAMV